MTEPLIQIRDLHFSRGSRPIFQGVDMDIQQGRITAVMGPSGTGKTTLLKLIGGQLQPDRGQILFQGQDVHKLSRYDLYQLRKRMGMLFQSGALLTDINVFDNVAFPLREHTKLPEAVIYQLVMLKLQAVGLRGAAELMPSELSGGMARRVALARAIALDPMMIMYDEPFTGQDPISMGVLVKLIRNTNHSLQLSSIVVSHDVEETLSISDDVFIISDGRVVASGTPDELQATESDWVKQFLQGHADGPVPFHFKAPSWDEALGRQAKS